MPIAAASALASGTSLGRGLRALLRLLLPIGLLVGPGCGGRVSGGRAGGSGDSGAGQGGAAGSNVDAGGGAGGGAGSGGGAGGGPAGSCPSPVQGAKVPSVPAWVDTRADVDCEVAEGAAMVYDAAAKLLLLVGGERDDFTRMRTAIFTWGGKGNWTKGGAGLPIARHGMAYAENAKATYVFGGTKATSLAPLGDTWKLPSGAAFQKVGGAGPPARMGSPLAYSAATGKIYLFGGGSGSTYLDDTWELDPTTDAWRQLSPANKPPARHSHTFTAAALDGLIYLFGGTNGSSLDDTWAFDPKAGDWCRIDAKGPSARNLAGAAYHEKAGVIVLHGGQAGKSRLPDTWLFDVSMRAWVSSPAMAVWQGIGTIERTGQATAYDPDAGTVVMQGGVAFVGSYDAFPHNTFTFGMAPVSGGPMLSMCF